MVTTKKARGGGQGNASRGGRGRGGQKREEQRGGRGRFCGQSGEGGEGLVRGLSSATHLAFCLVLTEKPRIVAMRTLRSFSSSESASVRSLSLCS